MGLTLIFLDDTDQLFKFMTPYKKIFEGKTDVIAQDKAIIYLLPHFH